MALERVIFCFVRYFFFVCEREIVCYFPRYSGRLDVPEFKCGCCPECLSSKASAVALKAVAEASNHASNCMITCTYDSYVRDSSGRILCERAPDSSLHVCKRDVQAFIKRLRRYCDYHYGIRIKYRVAAEYGSKTHRAHYHIIIFGFCFPDIVLYKRSKRGNQIYKSAILTSLWKHGICTVDSINITASVARYCTKYMSKQFSSEDTFSLCSRKIGFDKLNADFNGKSYMLAGVELPIPRDIWEYQVTKHFGLLHPDMDFRYVRRPKLSDGDFYDVRAELYRRSCRRRFFYRRVRDSWIVYQQYRDYWLSKIRSFEASRPSRVERIAALDSRFLHYKVLAFRAIALESIDRPFYVPRSRTMVSEKFGTEYDFCVAHDLPLPSRHIRANDTKIVEMPEPFENPFDFPEKFSKNYLTRYRKCGIM